MSVSSPIAPLDACKKKMQQLTKEDISVWDWNCVNAQYTMQYSWIIKNTKT